MQLLAFVIAFGILFAGCWWRGYVMVVLWGWFAVSIFSMPPIGVPVAVGVQMLASLCTHQRPPSRENSMDEFRKSMLHMVMFPLMCLLAGFIAKQFI